MIELENKEGKKLVMTPDDLRDLFRASVSEGEPTIYKMFVEDLPFVYINRTMFPNLVEITVKDVKLLEVQSEIVEKIVVHNLIKLKCLVDHEVEGIDNIEYIELERGTQNFTSRAMLSNSYF